MNSAIACPKPGCKRRRERSNTSLKNLGSTGPVDSTLSGLQPGITGENRSTVPEADEGAKCISTAMEAEEPIQG